MAMESGPEIELTEDQEARFDRLVDNAGFNNIQALIKVGAIGADALHFATKDSNENNHATEAPKHRVADGMNEYSHSRGRKKDGSIDKRTLSSRGKIAADKRPPDYFPYNA